MKKAIDLVPGDSLWLYTIDPNEPAFPIKEERFVITMSPSVGLTRFYLENEKGEKSARTIKALDCGINAQVKGRLYIWLTEKSLKKAFDIVKDCYMRRLALLKQESKILVEVFNNMSGWDHFFNDPDPFACQYSDDTVEETL